MHLINVIKYYLLKTLTNKYLQNRNKFTQNRSIEIFANIYITYQTLIDFFSLFLAPERLADEGVETPLQLSYFSSFYNLESNNANHLLISAIAFCITFPILLCSYRNLRILCDSYIIIFIYVRLEFVLLSVSIR